MFSVIHNKSIVKSFSIFLIIVFIIGFLPQPAVRADSVKQVDSPPTQLEILESNQIELVTTKGKLATFELHVKSPQNGAFFVWKLAEPAVNGSVNIAEANSQSIITYMPAAGFSGMDRFAIRVNDTQGNTNQIVFHVLVENDPESLDLKEPPNPKHEAGASINQLNSETMEAITMWVYPEYKEIDTNGWPENTEVTLSINGNVIESRTISGYQDFYSPQALHPGDTITLYSSEVTITHLIKDISVTSWDLKTDTVSGEATAGSEINVQALGDSDWVYRETSADTSGNWTADFAGDVDFQPGTQGWISQYDTEGNSTWFSWHIPNPYMAVYPLDDYVYGYDWTPNTEVKLTIGSDEWMTTSTDGGSVEFWLSPFDLASGQELVMSDEVYTRTHIVKNLAMTSYDETLETVSGVADIGFIFEIYACDDSNCEWVYPTVGSSGTWKAQFTEVNIKPGTSGWVFQHDAEGNSTQVPWHVKNQYFYVYHQYNEVYGNDWSPDSTITLTIEEQSWTTQSDSYGWFYMYLSPFDIIPGQSIHVTDGIDNRTHTVKNLDLTGFDIDTDTLTGTADPGELLLNVYSNGDGYSQEPIANEEGVWITDFSGTADITEESYGYLYQYDDAGNYTAFYWFIPNPYIYVYHLTNTIYGDEWSPNSTITVTIGSQFWTAQSDSDGWFRLSPTEFDILPGQSMKVTDGHSTRTHVVRNLAVTSIDIDDDILTGTADPGKLRVRACNNIWGCDSLYPEADTKGVWTAYFSGTTDITQDSYGYLYQYDEEGNYTQIYWYQPDPMVTAYLTDNYIYGDRWPAFADVSLSVAGTSFGTKTTDSYGEFYFFLGEFDLDVGQEIVITSPDYSTVTYTTQNIAFEGYDINDDTVWGTAEDGVVSVRACFEDGYYTYCYSEDSTVTNSAWLVDFTGTVDFVPGVDGSAGINDENGNRTVVGWFIPNPHFSVYLPNNHVSGSEWPIGSEIEVTISGIAGTFEGLANEYGNWFIMTGGVNIIPGMTVTVTGTTPDSTSLIQREHLVRNIKINHVDLQLNTIEGTTEPNAILDVLLIDADYYYGYWKNALSDLNGYWKVDFSDSIDIILGCSVQVTQEDDDGDATVIYEAIDTLSIYLPLIRR